MTQISEYSKKFYNILGNYFMLRFSLVNDWKRKYWLWRGVQFHPPIGLISDIIVISGQ
jgi:hypothetical protein